MMATECVKCGYVGDVSVKYDEVLQVLLRTCQECGYKWHEACRDARPPSRTASQSTQGAKLMGS